MFEMMEEVLGFVGGAHVLSDVVVLERLEADGTPK